MTELSAPKYLNSAEALQNKARLALSKIVPVTDGDGSLSVDYQGSPAVIRAINLDDGLDVLSLTQILAWDIPVEGLYQRVASLGLKMQFGSINVIEHGIKADVLLRYNFPAEGLSDAALVTLLLLVLSSGVDARKILCT
ncbi:MAG: hypothetical protein ACRCSF_09530 [Mycobacteriaceae bacterium]